MLLPQYIVGLKRSGKACSDIPLCDRDFYPNTKASHVAEIFSIFIRPTFMFITYHFRIFYSPLFSFQFICGSYHQISPHFSSPFETV